MKQNHINTIPIRCGDTYKIDKKNFTAIRPIEKAGEPRVWVMRAVFFSTASHVITGTGRMQITEKELLERIAEANIDSIADELECHSKSYYKRRPRKFVVRSKRK